MSSEVKPDRLEHNTDAAPLLTIAIPTYNRARFLKQLLTSLFEQLISEPRVELIISDNASPDETPDVVKEFMQRGLRIRSIRNEENIGPDANFLQCFEQARGKYVWIFGDDDVILPGGVRQVIDHLCREDYDLIYLAPCTYSRDYITGLVKPRRVAPSQVVSDVIRFIHLVNWQGDLVFISSLIINKQSVGRNHAPFKALAGTGLIQMGWALSALNNFKKGLFCGIGIIAGNADAATGGFNAGEVFGRNYYHAVAKVLGVESPLSRALINDLLVVWFSGNWLGLRRRPGGIVVDNPHRELQPIFGSNFRYWIFAYPLFGTPLPIAEAYFQLLRVARRAMRIIQNV